jgi:hypothetical protein
MEATEKRAVELDESAIAKVVGRVGVPPDDPAMATAPSERGRPLNAASLRTLSTQTRDRVLAFAGWSSGPAPSKLGPSHPRDPRNPRIRSFYPFPRMNALYTPIEIAK